MFYAISMSNSEFASSRYLITGGAGFIGLAFVKYLISIQPECGVVVLDKMTYASQDIEIKKLIDSCKKVSTTELKSTGLLIMKL